MIKNICLHLADKFLSSLIFLAFYDKRFKDMYDIDARIVSSSIKNVFFSRAYFFICEAVAVPKFRTAINPDIISRRLRKPSCGMHD